MAIANILPTKQNTLERIFLVSCTDDASRELGRNLISLENIMHLCRQTDS